MSNNIFQDEHEAVVGLAQKLIDGAEAKGEMTAQEQRLFDGLMGKADEIKSQATKRAAAMPEGQTITGDRESRVIRPTESYRDYHMRSGLIKAQDREITNNGFLRAMLGLPGASALEKRALGEGSDATGGVTVPVILSTMWIDNLRAQAVAFKAGAATVDLATETTNIAKLTADPVAAWVAEGSGPTESDPTFAKVQLIPKTVAVLTTFSVQLFDDGGNMFSTMLTNAVTKALSLALDKAAFYGTGASNQPTGIINTASIGSISMGTNGAVLTNYDQIANAVQTMQAANVYTPPTAAIMHPRSLFELNTAKMSTNAYITPPPVLDGLKYLATTSFPITETQGTSSTASSVLVGDFSQLLIGVRYNVRLQLLVERFMDTLTYGLIAFLRADIAVQHPQAFVRIQGVN